MSTQVSLEFLFCGIEEKFEEKTADKNDHVGTSNKRGIKSSGLCFHEKVT